MDDLAVAVALKRLELEGLSRLGRSRKANATSAMTAPEGIFAPLATQNSSPATAPLREPTSMGTCQSKILVRFSWSLTCGGTTGDIQ